MRRIVLPLLLSLAAAPALAQDTEEPAPSPAPSPAPAAAPAPELDERVQALRERYSRIEAQRGADAAEPALAHAARAIGAARGARQRGDVAASERALAIADAALVLADRLAARQRARSALEQTQRREREAHARATAAREALQRALLERARTANVAPSEAPSPPAAGEDE